MPTNSRAKVNCNPKTILVASSRVHVQKRFLVKMRFLVELACIVRALPPKPEQRVVFLKLVKQFAPSFVVLATATSAYTAVKRGISIPDMRPLPWWSQGSLVRKALYALVFSVGLALAVVYTVPVTGKVNFDGRSEVLEAAVLFLGPVLSFWVLLAGVALRVAEGGPAVYIGISMLVVVWGGCVVICFSCSRSLTSVRVSRLTAAVFCALLVSIASSVRMFFALTVFNNSSPGDSLSSPVICDAVIAVFMVQLFSTAALGGLVLLQLDRELFRKGVVESQKRMRRVLAAFPDLIAIQAMDGAVLDTVRTLLFQGEFSFALGDVADVPDNDKHLLVLHTPSTQSRIHRALSRGKLQQETITLGTFQERRSIWDVRTIALSSSSVLTIARDVTQETLTRETLDARTESLDVMLRNTRDLVGFVEPSETLTCLSPASETLTGYTLTQLAELPLKRLVEPRHYSRARESFLSVIEGKQTTAEFECGALTATGRRVWLDVRLSAVLNQDGTPSQRALFSARDATSRKTSEENALLRRQALDSLPNGVVTVNTRTCRISDVNLGFCKLTGYSAKDAEGQNLNDLLKSLVSASAPLSSESASPNYTLEGEFFSRRKDGSWFSEKRRTTSFEDDFTGMTYQVVLIEDLSAAQRDTLTKLPNRRYFINALKLALQSLPAHQAESGHSVAVLHDIEPSSGRAVAVFSVDLTKFSEINKSFGRKAGDLLLGAVSRGLSTLLDPSQALSRVESDEFALIVPHLCREATEQLAECLLDFFKEPLVIEGETIFVGANIGISIAYSNAMSAEELLQQSHLALEDTVPLGSGVYGYYDEKTRVASQRNTALGVCLRSALSERSTELYVEFQPKARLTDDKLLGFEALCRWKSPSLGKISPVEFIPIAESLGLIDQLGDYVFETICRQLVSWRDQGLLLAPVAVNISVQQLYSPDLGARLKSILDRCDLPAQLLELEVTESVLMSDVGRAVDALFLLREKGFKIALDDFGTGYSSMAYLQKLPLDVLKLDRSFVQNLGSNRESESICKSILGLARSLGLATVAEGVETSLQKQFLLDNGCDAMQGYLFAPPLAAYDAQAFLPRLRVESSLV